MDTFADHTHTHTKVHVIKKGEKSTGQGKDKIYKFKRNVCALVMALWLGRLGLIESVELRPNKQEV